MASIFTQKFRLPFFFLFFFNDPNISSTIHESNRLFCQKTEDHFIIKGSYKFFLYDFFSFFFLCLDRTLESVKKRGGGKKIILSFRHISSYQRKFLVVEEQRIGHRFVVGNVSRGRNDIRSSPLTHLSFSLSLVRKFFFNRSDCDSSTFFVFCLAKWMEKIDKEEEEEKCEREIFNLILGCKICSRSTHPSIPTIFERTSLRSYFPFNLPFIYLTPS